MMVPEGMDLPAAARALGELVLITAAYWLVDLTVRGDGFLRMARRLGMARESFAIALWVVPCLALAPLWSWHPEAQGEALRMLGVALSALLAWQGATRDYDPVAGGPGPRLRLLLVAVAAGAWVSPACLFAAGFLLTTPFGLWQHHATLPMRLIQVLMAHSLLAAWGPAGLFRDPAVAAFLLMTVAVSHYFITALAKGLLGPRWHSWVTSNRLHHLAASAYSWGWARFLPWPAWLRAIGALRRIEKPLQAAAFALEAASPLALLHPSAAVAFCLLWASFHLGVFAVSGLLFWDWILADLALAAMVLNLPPEASGTFGWGSVLASLAFMGLFPLRHKLWKPMPLGWFDTPFTQRIHWRVRGASGRTYGLYNDFMCPHERLYGKVHGCFLAPFPVITYHLGEVWKADLRDAIVAAGPDLERLEPVRRRYGILPVCPERAARHLAYLRRFFAALNAGARKHSLPEPLRWLKAPGDQIFYWGDLPAYKRQENVVAVTLLYREEYFDGVRLRRLREVTVAQVDVGPKLAGSGMPAGNGEGMDRDDLREPTPKEIDDFLLGFAAGRLIDLPGFGGGYVSGDDGKAARQRTPQAATARSRRGAARPAGRPASSEAR